MNYSEFENLVCQGCTGYGIDLDRTAVEKLYLYFQELKRWSQKVNLIARETADHAIVENHFIDSLALLMLLDEKQDSLLDIGSGAGFPGLVCKIARPPMVVSLVEPRLKRVSFLRHVIRRCDLKDVNVQSCRLEKHVVLEEESRFNCIVSRAVSDIPSFLALCDRFCVTERQVICMKGPRFREEIEESTDEDGRWKLSELREYNLPFSGASRALLSFTCKSRP
jgi:16S rRNA (guanine527-N7)-methyltransferase